MTSVTQRTRRSGEACAPACPPTFADPWTLISPYTDTSTMALAGGTRLGPYEIASAFGAGGPPSFAYASTRELRRGHAVAQEART